MVLALTPPLNDYMTFFPCFPSHGKKKKMTLESLMSLPIFSNSVTLYLLFLQPSGIYLVPRLSWIPSTWLVLSLPFLKLENKNQPQAPNCSRNCPTYATLLVNWLWVHLSDVAFLALLLSLGCHVCCGPTLGWQPIPASLWLMALWFTNHARLCKRLGFCVSNDS